MLTAEELKRRIEAARILRGLTQDQLADRLAEDGLGRYDLGRIERGDKDMQRIHRDALVRHLGVPERWFTSPDVEEIVGRKPSATLSPERALELVEQLAAEVAQGHPPSAAEPDSATGEADR